MTASIGTRMFVTAVALTTVLGLVGATISGVWTSNDAMFPVAISAFAVVAMLLLLRGPGNRIGGVLGVFSIIAASGFVLSGVEELVATPGRLASVAFAVDAFLWIPVVSLPIVLFVLFPDGRVPSRLAQVPLYLVAVFVPTAVAANIVPAERLAHLSGPAAVLIEVSGAIAGLALMTGTMGGLLVLVSRYRSGTSTERLQLRWLLFAAMLQAPALAIGDALQDGIGLVVMGATLSLFPVAIAVAVLRYRLYEIDRLLARTVSYTLLTAMLIGLYAVSVLALGIATRRLTGSDGDLVVAVSTLLVAATFQPLRQRTQALVDRRFNRGRYDAGRTIEVFGARLRDQVHLEALRQDLRAVVADVLQPTASDVWIREARS